MLKTMKSNQKQPLEVFFKKAVRKIFAIFTKNTCAGVFFDKVASLIDCNSIKKRLQHRCVSVPVNITKFLRTAFFIEHFWWLLLIKYHLIQP